MRRSLEYLSSGEPKIMFLGPACSKAALPVAESIHYWNVVQASLMILLKELYLLLYKKNKDGVSTEAEKGQSKNILQIQKNILNRNVFLKSLSKSLTNLKNYCKS